MQPAIRDVSDADLDAVLRLNQAEVPHVGPADLDKMRWFAQHADWFRVARSDAGLDAFLVGFRPGNVYASPNYRWFCERYDDFAYVDRIAVAPHARRRGLASALYRDFAAAMPPGVGLMTCEVNLVPPNDGSMRFHLQDGFTQVGTRDYEGGSKRVAMLAKQLRQGGPACRTRPG